MQAEMQWHQRVVAELHAELAPYRDNEQSAHSEQQRLQSEVEVSAQHSRVAHTRI